MEGIVFFLLWVFACLSCSEFGWRMPVVKDVLFASSLRKEWYL